MGTNYYLIVDVCECCGRGDETIHIGKSSAGWCFSLHVYPGEKEKPQNFKDWASLYHRENTIIQDEYGTTLTPYEMESVITKRGKRDPQKHRWNRSPLGYSSWQEFFSVNHAEKGPNGLLRHRHDPPSGPGCYGCVGHGAGTWDLIAGEFS